jgi:hypothetical protein
MRNQFWIQVSESGSLVFRRPDGVNGWASCIGACALLCVFLGFALFVMHSVYHQDDEWHAYPPKFKAALSEYEDIYNKSFPKERDHFEWIVHKEGDPIPKLPLLNGKLIVVNVGSKTSIDYNWAGLMFRGGETKRQAMRHRFAQSPDEVRFIVFIKEIEYPTGYEVSWRRGLSSGGGPITHKSHEIVLIDKATRRILSGVRFLPVPASDKETSSPPLDEERSYVFQHDYK